MEVMTVVGYKKDKCYTKYYGPCLYSYLDEMAFLQHII